MTGRANPQRPPPPPPRGGRGRAPRGAAAAAPYRAPNPSSDVSALASKTAEMDITKASSSSQETAPPSAVPRQRELPPSHPVEYRGKDGTKIQVASNYLELEVDKSKGVFEYEVRFEPRVDSREERFRLLNSLQAVTGETKNFDGSKLLLPVRLDKDAVRTDARHSKTGETVAVSILFKKQRSHGDRDVVQHYNILFNKIMRVLKFTMHRRNFYDAKGAHEIRQYNLQVWPGYVTAVDDYEGGLLLQIDVSHRVLRTETVKDFILSLGSKKGVRPGDLKSEAEKALLGTSILTRYNNKTYKIDELDFESSPKSTFTNEKGEQVSFIDYYKKQYGITIKDPDQPMIIHRARRTAVSEEETVKLICLVPELCMLTGMSEVMRSDFKIMSEVARYTRITPQQRQDDMNNFLRRVRGNEAAKAILSQWGLSVKEEPVRLTGRLLPSPVMHFGQGQRETVGPRGDWSRAATNKPVMTPVHLTKWAILFTERSKDDVRKFCKTMQQLAGRMGINVANPKVIALPNDRTETYLEALRPVIDPTTQLVLTVVPQQRSDRYAAIKKLCYVEKPVASQVVLLKSINNEKKMSAVASKVVLQINCKLGGELWACQPQQGQPFKDLMVVGIDVYHDKSRKSGSVAGVVASINDPMTRYYSTVAIQRQGQEITDALTVSFMDALIKYWETNHKWPRNIVVYRDGVSDGQMSMVQAHEVTQFLRTFRHINDASGIPAENADRHQKLGKILPSDYNPGFNFIVVQKRINTRIFKADQAQFQNPNAGTILDHTVTRRNFKDFFLVPQSVTQGTVTPTHFVVLSEHGPGALEATDVQKLTYMMTHMYYNWPGTVRVPAPCQYAHKMVDMAGATLHNVPSPELNEKLYFL